MYLPRDQYQDLWSYEQTQIIITGSCSVCASADGSWWRGTLDANPEFNVLLAQESIPPAYILRARICKRLGSQGSILPAYVSWRADT
jgi:hypothetical protein